MPASSLSGETGMVTPFQVHLWLGGGEMYFAAYVQPAPRVRPFLAVRPGANPLGSPELHCLIWERG